MKRIIGIFASLFLVTTFFTSCGEKTTPEKDFTIRLITEDDMVMRGTGQELIMTSGGFGDLLEVNNIVAYDSWFKKANVPVGSAMITDYIGKKKNADIVIPETIEGYPVTVINSSGSGFKEIKSIRFPDTILAIEGDFSGGFRRSKKAIMLKGELPSKLKYIKGSPNLYKKGTLKYPDGIEFINGLFVADKYQFPDKVNIMMDIHPYRFGKSFNLPSKQVKYLSFGLMHNDNIIKQISLPENIGFFLPCDYNFDALEEIIIPDNFSVDYYDEYVDTKENKGNLSKIFHGKALTAKGFKYGESLKSIGIADTKKNPLRETNFIDRLKAENNPEEYYWMDFDGWFIFEPNTGIRYPL